MVINWHSAREQASLLVAECVAACRIVSVSKYERRLSGMQLTRCLSSLKSWYLEASAVPVLGCEVSLLLGLGGDFSLLLDGLSEHGVFKLSRSARSCSMVLAYQSWR